MTNKSVVLVARAVALYLLCWMGSELTNLPARILSVYHHLRYPDHFSTVQRYYQDLYILELGFSLIRVIGLFLVAGWLYRCGPKVRAFFVQPTSEKEG